MKLFDEKFRNNKLQYFFQCFLATLSILLFLLILDVFPNAVVIASLGSSSFIAFAMPQAQSSKPRFLIGGYLVGTTVACICFYISMIPVLTILPFLPEYSYVVFGAIAVGLTIFIMVITNTEHPPAASLALGLIINECNYVTILVVLIGITSLSAIKAVLKPVLKNIL